MKQTTLHGKLWLFTSYPGGNKQEKLKKAFRLKLLELGKTRTKKAGPDLSNFYVIMAGHDMVSNASRATTCRCKFNAPSLQTRSKKTKDIPKIWVSTWKPFEDFRWKEKKCISSLDQRTPWNKRPFMANFDCLPRTQEEINKKNWKKPSD